MRKKIKEEIEIPAGINCSMDGNIFSCSKAQVSMKRKISIPYSKMSVANGKVVIESDNANKKIISFVKTNVAHVKNMIAGLDKSFVYEMEICNVHFPMTVKVEGSKFVVTNFLGEKEKRVANILPGVDVEVKGNQVTVSSHDTEAAGQTAANIEKATKISKRDRRVFQDGIFITSKPGAEE